VDETVPVFIGITLALACELVEGRTARRLTWLGASAAGGVTATVVTGESALSWAFVLIDLPIVGLTAVVTRLVVLRAARRFPVGVLRPYVHGEP
jgi:hypothetical protein